MDPDDREWLFAAPGRTEALDAIAVECETCGWWVEADEVDGDGECGDCRDA